ncbi:MAG: DUF3473 domain-containing protein [Actinomycetota bacterium]
MSVVFTLDLEDHRPDESAELRFPAITDELLDDLEKWGVVGTVFVVGDVVRDQPDLVARVAARGHEVGLHGATHTPLPEVGPDTFATVTAEAMDRLAQVIQAPVDGFRAPIFSLVPDSAWAPDILADLGFEYSSSVLPARNPLYGWPGAPDGPFRWPSGLVEIPSPIYGFGPAHVPLLGGVYLRVAPMPLIRWAAKRAPQHAWLYSHPYDFDPGEARWLLPEVGRLGSRVMWWGRKGMKNRVEAIVSNTERRMIDIVKELPADLPVFEPAVV